MKVNDKQNKEIWAQNSKKISDLRNVATLSAKEMTADNGGKSSTKQAEAWLRALGGNNNGF